MNDVIRKNDLFIFKNLFSEEECFSILNFALKEPSSGITDEIIYNRNHFIEINDSLKVIIKSKLSRKLVPKYSLEFPNFLIPKECSVLAYSDGYGADLHTDLPEYDKNFDFTFLTFLNDDYKGGELYFPDFNISLKSKGTSVLFPCTFLYPHTVLPITKGTRYCLMVRLKQYKKDKNFDDKFYTLL
jgi:hypothetical protein